MTKELNSNIPKVVRDSLLRAVELSDSILEREKLLIEMLTEIDQRKFYVKFGFKSLMGFCNHGLGLTKTQSQRIVTCVRRSPIREAKVVAPPVYYNKPTILSSANARQLALKKERLLASKKERLMASNKAEDIDSSTVAENDAGKVRRCGPIANIEREKGTGRFKSWRSFD